MNTVIKDISQTAILVAGCRAFEHTQKPSLIKDHLAGSLLSTEDVKLFELFKNSAQFSLFNTSVIVRTLVLDNMILNLLSKEDITQVINLGAGLDTRPYRMSLSKELIWWEIDHKNITITKEKALRNYTPNCIVKRKAIDLNSIDKFKIFINKEIDKEKKTLVFSEGILIYLDPEIVSKLLSIFANLSLCTHWITDVGTIKNRNFQKSQSKSTFTQLLKHMKFYSSPNDKIYAAHNWKVKQFKDLAIEAINYNRPLTLAEDNTAMDQQFLELCSLEWAGLHYFLCLENANYTSQ